jgi:hypothetical protein
MKFSILIAAIILALAALFAVPRNQKIKTLTTEWIELENEADKVGVPTDPKATFSSDRVRAESTRVAKEAKVNDFADELIAFFHKMKTLEKQGENEQSKYMKEIGKVIEKMTSLNPDELRLLVKAISVDTSVDKKSKLELIGFATMMLAAENPEAALAIALEARESLDAKNQQNDHMLQMILQQYAAKDPLAAAQWLSDNEEKIGTVEDHVKRSMIRAAAQQDIGAAMGIIDTLKMSGNEHAFSSLSTGVTVDNADAFIAALRDSTANEIQRKNAFNALHASQIFKDFDTATTWLAKDSITPQERDAITKSLQYHAIKDEPEKWLSWLSSTAEVSESQASATENIIAGWARADFAATGEWINAQPASSQKNQCILTYANTLAPFEPAAAAEWATTLPKGADRNEALKNIHRNYQGKDPKAAAAFAEKHGIKVD